MKSGLQCRKTTPNWIHGTGRRQGPWPTVASRLISYGEFQSNLSHLQSSLVHRLKEWANNKASTAIREEALKRVTNDVRRMFRRMFHLDKKLKNLVNKMEYDHKNPDAAHAIDNLIRSMTSHERSDCKRSFVFLGRDHPYESDQIFKCSSWECSKQDESDKIFFSAVRTAHDWDSCSNLITVLTDYRSGWTDCEICKKDVDAKPNLSWMTKSHLKIAKTLSRKDPMTVKDDGVMVDELDEAVVTVMTPWTGYDRDSVRSSQMKYRRSGILQTTKIFQTAQSSIAGQCKSRLVQRPKPADAVRGIRSLV